MLNFERLQTPPHDGDILIEPAPSAWPALINAGRQTPLQDLVLAGTPAEVLRTRTRRAVWGAEPDVPVIACGHQPTFIHPGVWAKNVVVARLIDLLGLAGGDLVVDNDTPHWQGLNVPCVGPDGLVRLETIPWGEAPAGAACEGQPALPPDFLQEVKRRLAELLPDVFPESALPDYLEGFGRNGPTRDLIGQHMAGRAQVDQPLGAGLHAVRVSQAFGGPFLADLMLNADRFADAYNQALHEYRVQHHVRGPDRPLPDLAHHDNAIETALWIYRPGQRRRRLFVGREAGRLNLYADLEPVDRLDNDDLTRRPDDALASLTPWVVRPRALTLTLWARLLACDLFVHGIGGAKYDRITDHIFRNYYHLPPPPFACVSATLRLPLPRHPKAEANLPAARHRTRDLRHNPQRYLEIETGPRELLARRMHLIEETNRLRASRGPRSARRTVYTEIQRVNTELLSTQPDLGEQMQREINRLTKEFHSHRLAVGREYFYALQPRQRLIEIAEQLADALEPAAHPKNVDSLRDSR
ncbi:MAG TPA: hypothetical protein VLM89_12900 [Phycisphaerae bacterium]|nr:hypothetical protein [Phycisphaerae bacterium]